MLKNLGSGVFPQKIRLSDTFMDLEIAMSSVTSSASMAYPFVGFTLL